MSGAGRAAWLIFGIVLAIYVSTAGGSLTSTDAVVTYDLTKNLVERRSIALTSTALGVQARPGRDGRPYSTFGIGQSIYNIPFYLAGRAIERMAGARIGKPDSITKAAVALGSTVAAAGAVAVSFLFAWRLTGELAPAALSAFSLGFATILWPYSKFGFNVVLASWLLVGGAYLAWVGVRLRRDPSVVAAGVLLGLFLLTRHEALVLMIPIGAWIAWESRSDRRVLTRRLTLCVLPVAVSAGFWLGYNLVRFGNPFDSGQVIAGESSLEMLRNPVRSFTRPTLDGVWGLLASPGSSLFVYSPVTILGVWALVRLYRRDRSTAVLFGGLAIALLSFFASLESWSGGRSYGSRYLLPILPFLCIPIGPWLRDAGRPARYGFVGLLMMSSLVQLPGVLVDYSKVSIDFARAHPQVSGRERAYLWRAAPILLNAQAAVKAVPPNIRYVSGVDDPPRVDRTADNARRDFSQQFAFSLDFWWLYLFYLGAIPAAAALACLLCPLAVAAWLGSRLARIVGGHTEADHLHGAKYS